MKEPAYQLEVKFIGGGTIPGGEFTSHHLALEAAQVFVLFLKEEHMAHRTGIVFEESVVNADTISVTKTDHRKRFNPTGLYLVLKIKEIKEIEYDHNWKRKEIATEHVKSREE